MIKLSERKIINRILLEVKNLSVGINGKEILRNVNFDVKKGEIALLLGPNGSGKSTLAQAILGNPKYSVFNGDILFEGKEITNYSMEERVKLGITSSFQFPPKIKGIKLREIAEEMLKKKGIIDDKEVIDTMASLLNLTEHLDRDLNVGFSGGEMRRAELFLIFIQSPKFVILDEIDSGVDVESIAIIGKAIQKMMLTKTHGIIIITHSGLIGKYIQADRAYVMINGTMICSGKADEILRCIYTYGFSKCLKKGDRNGFKDR